jgi:type IV pilus assembly protein PilN
MEDLETVLPAGVQVQTLEPTVKNGQISVRLRVLGPRDRDVELVQNLEHSHHFMMPRIVGEAAESTGTPGQPQPVSAGNRVDFDIQADYAPGAAEERKQAREKSAHAKKGETGSAESNAGSQHNRISRPKAPIAHYPGVPR